LDLYPFVTDSIIKAMKNILLPTDFSKNAQNAIDYALSLYGNEGCNFILFHTLFMPVNVMDGLAPSMEGMMDNANKSLGEQAEIVRAKLEGTTSTFETKLVTGSDIVYSIEEGAKTAHAQLVILGTKGASGLTEVLIGSNTEGLIRKSNLPIIAIPENAKYSEPKNILFAADLKKIKHKEILQPVTELATKYNSNLTLLTVSKEGILAGNEEAWEGYFLHKEFANISHHADVVEGKKPHEQIESYIAENNPDLLVMISRHNHFWDRIFHKSVTGKMAMHTTVPLMALHDDALEV
jgi:nucleotide-binding universal stress UspA family protein